MIKKALIAINFLFICSLLTASYALASHSDFRSNLSVEERVALEREEGNLNPNEVIALKNKYRSTDEQHVMDTHTVCNDYRSMLSWKDKIKLERDEENLGPNEVIAKEFDLKAIPSIRTYTSTMHSNNANDCNIVSLRENLSTIERKALAKEEATGK